MKRKIIHIQWLVGLCLVLATSVNAQDQEFFVKEMLALKDWYFNNAVHPETYLIYQKVNLEDPEHWKNTQFPTPESIRLRVCDDSEVPNVSNCAITGGVFLGFLVDAYQISGDDKIREQARVVFDGLKKLASVSTRRGFIARSILPGDPTNAHLINSSVDQYTFYVYGLYKYYYSSLSGEEEKQEIRRIMTDICTMIEKDGTILSTIGTPAKVSDIAAIRSDRSSRLLATYIVGWAVTDDPHWRQVYLEKVKEADYERLKTLLDPHRVKRPYLPRDELADPLIWVQLQTQYSLVPLFELEPDITIKACYLEAMRINAEIAEETEKSARHEHSLPIILLAQNRFLQGSVTSPARTLEQKRLREKTRNTLKNMDRSTRAKHEIYGFGLARGVL